MVDPADTNLTQQDQQVAIALMSALIKSLGDGSEPVSAKDVHKVLALMSAMVMETDATLTAPSQYRKAGAYIGELIAMFAKMARDERERTGIGLMELAAMSGTTKIN